MRLIQDGRVDAFEELYDRYSARAHRLARSVCPVGRWAEEAVQEAFVSVWRGRAAYRAPRGTVAAWLLSVVQDRAIDMLRRNGAQRWHGEGPRPGAVEDPAEDEARELRMLLASLPDPQREVIALAIFGELSQQEIAKQLALPPGTVGRRMRLGLHTLRARREHAAA